MISTIMQVSKVFLRHKVDTSHSNWSWGSEDKKAFWILHILIALQSDKQWTGDGDIKILIVSENFK